jgi:hypothetical protein
VVQYRSSPLLANSGSRVAVGVDVGGFDVVHQFLGGSQGIGSHVEPSARVRFVHVGGPL